MKLRNQNRSLKISLVLTVIASFISVVGSADADESKSSLEGDAEYGEYLAGECVTCHKLNGDNEGIPSIIGLPKDKFIDALIQYKTELRKNPIMRTAAKRLGDEEMAALAAYFNALTQE